jgi:hypothetical protein
MGGLVRVGQSLIDQLFFTERVTTFREPGEVFGTNISPRAEVLGKTALPLTVDVVALGVIRLRTAGELLDVVLLRLARTQRARDGEHQSK